MPNMATLAQLRIQRMYLQREVAEALRVTVQAVGNWERGIYKPALPKQRELAKFYQLAPEVIAQAIRETAQAREKEDIPDDDAMERERGKNEQ